MTDMGHSGWLRTQRPLVTTSLLPKHLDSKVSLALMIYLSFLLGFQGPWKQETMSHLSLYPWHKDGKGVKQLLNICFAKHPKLSPTNWCERQPLLQTRTGVHQCLPQRRNQAQKIKMENGDATFFLFNCLYFATRFQEIGVQCRSSPGTWAQRRQGRRKRSRRKMSPPNKLP